MLLPDAALPGLNEQAGWRTVRTSKGESERPRWVCQRFSLVSNGAVNAVQRSFESTKGNATAAQVIAIEGKTPRQGSDKATARSAIPVTGARATAHHIDLGQEVGRKGKRMIAASDHDSLKYVLYGA